MGADIQLVKKSVMLESWRAEIESCQASGMTVRKWCELNGVNIKTYYYHLRRVRERFLEDRNNNVQTVVGIGAVGQAADKIEITDGSLRISMPDNISPELLLTAIGGLKDAR